MNIKNGKQKIIKTNAAIEDVVWKNNNLFTIETSPKKKNYYSLRNISENKTIHEFKALNAFFSPQGRIIINGNSYLDIENLNLYPVIDSKQLWRKVYPSNNEKLWATLSEDDKVFTCWYVKMWKAT